MCLKGKKIRLVLHGRQIVTAINTMSVRWLYQAFLDTQLSAITVS